MTGISKFFALRFVWNIENRAYKYISLQIYAMTSYGEESLIKLNGDPEHCESEYDVIPLTTSASARYRKFSRFRLRTLAEASS